jgi:hypothetical protein
VLKRLILAGAVLLVATPSHGGELGFKGQLSGTLQLVESGDSNPLAGLLYIPEVGFERESGSGSFDAQLALTASAFGPLKDPDALVDSADIDLYRASLRFATDQSEVRVGLQRISFGPAFLIRPLMWFDRIDPRDPLQITEGVYGVLGRRYFLNNANLWGWILYGNDEPKGFELLPTEESSPEAGGRFQAPLLGGELGASAHYRRVDESVLPAIEGGPSSESTPEYRLGLDGRWDATIGLWFEGVVLRRDSDRFEDSQNLITLGGDYTFGVGNGLHVLGEHFYGDGLAPVGAGSTSSVSALTADYPVGLSDSLALFVTYSWRDAVWSRFFRWGHSFPRWNLYLLGLWNDELDSERPLERDDLLVGGKALQLLVVYSH